MPTRRPDYHEGGFYHFFNRGAHRVALFREHDNYVFVLRKMKTYVPAFDLAIIAYGLMPNHYHLLVRQDGRHPARLLPQRVFNRLSKAYNRRYGHSGTLFEGPYKVAVVEDRAHLPHACRHIHANPVRDGLVCEPGAWQYSNYREWVGERGGALVDRAFVRAFFPSAGDYRAFVGDYLSGLVGGGECPDVLGVEGWG